MFLTEHSHEFICIIAGYKDAIEKCFFSINQGLRRRFTNNFIISPYTHEELSQIFLKFFVDRKYVVSISLEQITEFFKNEIRNFPFHAGDVKTFMEKCLIYKGNLRMIEEKEGWYVISKKDMDEGYKIYLEERVPIGFEVEENDFKSMFV